MNIIGFVGHSGSGKTHLIQRLIPELKRRGFSVAVIKHCPHGFDLDRDVTDSSKFDRAGADGVSLLSASQWAVMRPAPDSKDFVTLARACFADMDVVLVEGGKGDESLDKIMVFASGAKDVPEGVKGRILASVAKDPVAAYSPTFHPDGVAEIADFMFNHWISDTANAKRIPLSVKQKEK